MSTHIDNKDSAWLCIHWTRFSNVECILCVLTNYVVILGSWKANVYVCTHWQEIVCKTVHSLDLFLKCGVFSPEKNWQGPRSREVGGGGNYTHRYTVTTRMMPAWRWAAMRAILMFHSLWWTKSQDSVHRPQLLKRKESPSGGIEPTFVCLPTRKLHMCLTIKLKLLRCPFIIYAHT